MNEVLKTIITIGLGGFSIAFLIGAFQALKDNPNKHKHLHS